MYTTDQADKTIQGKQPLEKTNKPMAKSKQEDKNKKRKYQGKNQTKPWQHQGNHNNQPS